MFRDFPWSSRISSVFLGSMLFPTIFRDFRKYSRILNAFLRSLLFPTMCRNLPRYSRIFNVSTVLYFFPQCFVNSQGIPESPTLSRGFSCCLQCSVISQGIPGSSAFPKLFHDPQRFRSFHWFSVVSEAFAAFPTAFQGKNPQNSHLASVSKRKRKADSTQGSSQAVPHPSTNRALRCLTSEVERDPVHSTRYGRRRQVILRKMHEPLQLDSLRGSSVKIGTIQRRLAWPLRKDDTHKSRSVLIFLLFAVLAKTRHGKEQTSKCSPKARKRLAEGKRKALKKNLPLACRTHAECLTRLTKCTQNARRLHANTLVKGLRLAGQMLGQCLQKARQMRPQCATNA